MGYKEIEDFKFLAIFWCLILEYFRLFSSAV
jgi:hypothetical protein